MASFSAFGFGGYDPLGSYAEGAMNNFWSAKAAARNAALEYKYAEKYAKNGPSWNVEGLRTAGLNPILAASQNFGAVTISSAKDGIVPSRASGGYDPSVFAAGKAAGAAKKLALEQAAADVEATRSNAVAARVSASAAAQQAETSQWTIYDARHEGVAGFRVQGIAGVKFGAGAEGNVKVVTSIRINKVTGEVYDVYSGERVKVLGEVPVSSAKKTPNIVRVPRGTSRDVKPNVPRGTSRDVGPSPRMRHEMGVRSAPPTKRRRHN